jgi:hypothetical protein
VILKITQTPEIFQLQSIRVVTYGPKHEHKYGILFNLWPTQLTAFDTYHTRHGPKSGKIQSYSKNKVATVSRVMTGSEQDTPQYLTT